jgi:threonine dehydrogenase-like Zn-dependent dehydrogenase
MKALVWRGPERLAIEDVEQPEAGPGAVLLAPEAVGICGSEVEGYLGHMANRVPPLVMGHEFAGRVVAVGQGVDPAWLGRRAAVNPLLPGEGARPGRENLAPNRTLIGIQHPGAFAAAVRVPEAALRPMPEDADPRLGALAEPLANGVHAVGLGLAGAAPDEVARTVVLGAGTIGIMVLQAGLLAGLPHVASVEPHAERRARAQALGAHATHASAAEAGEADVVLDAVGAEATRRAAVELVRPGGRAVMVGLAADETTLGFHAVVRRQIAIQGSYAYTPPEYDRALAWLLEGRAGLDELPPVEPLEAGPEAFAALARGPGSRVKVFLAAEPQA